MTQELPGAEGDPNGAREDEETGTKVVSAIERPSSGEEGKKEPRKKNLQPLLKMVRELALVGLIYLVLMSPSPAGVFQNLGFAKRLATRPPAPPVKFFEGSSSDFVEDYFNGDIYTAFERAQHHEDAFFMFYAPWDVDSMYARDEMLKVARDLSDHVDIFFAAVNCWTNNGDCFRDFGQGKDRQNFGKQLPILVYYPRDRKGLQYGGPLSADHIMRFILNAYQPVVTNVHSRDQLLELLAAYGGQGLVGSFTHLQGTSSGSSPGLSYRRFLHAAYVSLEYDAFRELGPWVVVTSPLLAYNLHLNQNSPIRYFHWNSSSLAYPNRTVTSSEALLNWTYKTARENLNTLTTWIGTSGKKSAALHAHLNAGSGNSLLVFLPRNFGDYRDPNLSMVQEVALRYFSCGDDVKRMSWEMLEAMEALRKTTGLRLELDLAECMEDPWFREYFCKPAVNCGECGRSVLCQANGTIQTWTAAFSAFRERYFFNLGSGPTIDLNVHNFAVAQRRLECLLASKEKDAFSCDMFFGDHVEDENLANAVYGLSCHDNKTLNFYTLDWKTQSELARNIGLSTADKSAKAVIVSRSAETIYNMKGDFSVENLSQFLLDFHANNLEALSRLKLDIEPEAVKTRKEKSREDWLGDEDKVSQIRVLAGSEFEDTVFNSSQNVVLLYTSRYCGMCASFAHVLHSAQHLMSSASPELVTFAMVDAGVVDLPWHLTALSVPTILFFPAGDTRAKAETRAFPAEKALSVPNLISFIVANLQPEKRLQLSLTLCDDDCLANSRVEVAKKMISHSGENVEMAKLNALDLKLQEERNKRLESARYVEKRSRQDIEEGLEAMQDQDQESKSTVGPVHMHSEL